MNRWIIPVMTKTFNIILQLPAIDIIFSFQELAIASAYPRESKNVIKLKFKDLPHSSSA